MEASPEPGLEFPKQYGPPGISVSLWSAYLSSDYLSISHGVTSNKQLAESDTLVHQFHLRFPWQASLLLNHRGWFMGRLSTDGPFLPGWAWSQPHAVKVNFGLLLRLLLLSLACIHRRRGIPLWMHVCMHACMHLSIHPSIHLSI